jgi:hypothetical protein
MTAMDPKQQLLRWFKAEYAGRTAAVKNGTAKIDWIVPEYRITWSEIMSKARDLGINDNIVDLRWWWGSTSEAKKRRK